MEDARVNRIGNVSDILPHEQTTPARLTSKPLATCHELDGVLGQDTSLTLPDTIRKVVLAATSWQQWALLAVSGETGT